MPNIDERLTTYLDKCRKIIGIWNARDISPNRFGVAATIVEPLFEQLGFDILDGREITRGKVCEDPGLAAISTAFTSTARCRRR